MPEGKPAALYGHVNPWRHDVNAIGPQKHTLLDLDNKHLGGFRKEVHQDFWLVEAPVLCNHEGHSRVGGQCAQNLKVWLQASSRRTQTHDFKIFAHRRTIYCACKLR